MLPLKLSNAPRFSPNILKSSKYQYPWRYEGISQFRASRILGLCLLLAAAACGSDDPLLRPDAGIDDAGSGDAAVECLTPSDCAGEDSDCQMRTCIDGICGLVQAAQGTIAATQQAGDCNVLVCDGEGGVIKQIDPSDIHVSDVQCIHWICEGGNAFFVNDEFGSACNDEDPCTQGDFCQLGECIAGAPVACTGDAVCSEGVCVTGECKGTLSFPGAPTTPLSPDPSGSEIPWSMAAADFNGDGFSDLVVASEKRLQFLFGHGDGSFDPPVINEAVQSPQALVAADFNEDGTVDLAVTRSGGVTVLFNSGNSLFSNGFSDSAGASSESIIAADLNGDAKPDLALVSDSVVVVFLNQGGGMFSPPLVLPGGQHLKSVIAAELNGDGALDLVIADSGLSGHQVSVFLNQGNGSFGPKTDYSMGTSSWPNSLVAMELNGDNALDLLSVTESGTGILLNKGDGTFIVGDWEPWGSRVTMAADIDDWPGPELLTIDTVELGVIHRFGNTWYGPNQYFAGKAYSMALGDFNGDGLLDLAAANNIWDGINSVNVLLNQGGSFAAPTFFEMGASYYSEAMVAADLNGDYKTDIAIVFDESNDIAVLLNQGDGTFGEAWSYPVGESPEDVKAADLNGDGALDLVVANGISMQVSVLLNQGNGLFLNALHYDLPFEFRSLDILDINGDGFPDLLVPQLYLDALLNKGDGTFLPPVKVGDSPSEPNSMAVADLNGDAKPDLALATISKVYVQFNHGDETFEKPVELSEGAFFNSIVVVDINGDSKPDLVAADMWADEVLVFENLGNGSFSAAVKYQVGYYPKAVFASDLDGDGWMDLAVANFIGATIGVLMNQGNGSFERGPAYAAGWAPAVLAAGDINNDGRPDLLTSAVGDYQTTKLSVLLNVCTP